MADPVVSTAPLSRRDQHLSSMLSTLLRSPVARKQLSESTGIGFGTITRLTNHLLVAGFVHEGQPKPGPRSRGRPEVPLLLGGPGGKIVVGTQIHTDRVTTDAFTLTGERLLSESRPHPGGDSATMIGTAIELTRRLGDRFEPGRVIGVGVSTGGQVDYDTGVVLDSPRLGWADVDLRTPFRTGLDVPVVVDNSVRSLALARSWWSSSIAGPLLVVVVAGAISSAMVVDGSLYRGASHRAGDVAHLAVPGAPGGRCPECPGVGCASGVLTDVAVHRDAVGQGLLPGDSHWEALFAAPYRVGLEPLLARRAELLGHTLATLLDFVDPVTTVLVGRIGSPEDVYGCLELARRGRGGERSVLHLDADTHQWGAGAAALVLDDLMRVPTRYLG